LSRCKHCQILFLTDPRNAGRTDLGCPFGCSEAHRKKESTKRSVDYNRSRVGKIKKKQINAQRSEKVEIKKETKDQFNLKDFIDIKILIYLQSLISQIEGHAFSILDIILMVRKILRQHSMYKGKNTIYKRPYD